MVIARAYEQTDTTRGSRKQPTRRMHSMTVTQFLHLCQLFSRHDVGQTLINVCHCNITLLV